MSAKVQLKIIKGKNFTFLEGLMASRIYGNMAA